MQSQVTNRDLPYMDRVYLNFALGKAFEDAKDFARSFAFYAQGNRLKRQQSNYDADQMSEDLRAQARYFTREVLGSREGAGCDAVDPIFIVGLPRAGSTLLEQILSSHSQVEGTLELPNILSMAQKLRRQGRDKDGKPYPYLLQDLGNEALRDLGRQYIEETRIHNDYMNIMAHWDAVSPGSILRVHYERVVEDLEAQVRRLLDYCGLPFEEACLSFYNTDRAVRTASSEQVRQPIYQSGIEQWTHFEPFLGSLKKVLQPSLERYQAG